MKIEWLENDKGINTFGDWYAHIGEHVLITHMKAIVTLDIECMWIITDKQGKVCHHGDLSARALDLPIGKETNALLVEHAKQKAEEVYVEKIGIHKIFEDEVL